MPPYIFKINGREYSSVGMSVCEMEQYLKLEALSRKVERELECRTPPPTLAPIPTPKQPSAPRQIHQKMVQRDRDYLPKWVKIINGEPEITPYISYTEKDEAIHAGIMEIIQEGQWHSYNEFREKFSITGKKTQKEDGPVRSVMCRMLLSRDLVALQKSSITHSPILYASREEYETSPAAGLRRWTC